MSVPSDEDIDSFLEFTGSTSRSVALSFIKGNRGDVQNAVGEYYTDSDPRRYENNVTWDDAAFAGDREGTLPASNAGSLVPYNELESGGPGPIYGPHPAPSRPPSRAAYYKEHAPVWASGNRAEYEGENEAIQRSMFELSSGQETGVIDARGHEYVPDTDPHQRVRKDGDPAFLKPLPNHDFLPALVTILQAIPQINLALSFGNHPSSDYGQDDHWWEGESISDLQIRDLSVHRDIVHDGEAVIKETQRLMAFLPETRRSYGSVASLVRLLGEDVTYTAPWSDGPQFGEALSAWDSLLTSDGKGSLFTSELQVAASSVPSVPGQQIVHFDADVVYGLDREEATLYDSLNQALWGHSWKPSVAINGWLHKAAPVAVMRVQQPWQTHGAPRKLKVPELFYADRYMADNSEYMKEVGQQMTVHQETLGAVNEKLSRLGKFTPTHTWSDSSSGTDAGLLMKTVIGFLKERARGATEGHSNNDTVVPDQAVDASPEALIAQLESINARVESRIRSLNEEKEAARAALRELSATLTESSCDPKSKPRMAYELRGVATVRLNQPAVTYIPARAEVADDAGGQISKWWKICYETTGSTARVSKYQVANSLVVEAAGSCSADTLLVYASRDLLESDAERSELPDGLATFVKQDNDLFAAELERQTGPRNQMSEVPPRSELDRGRGRRLSYDSTTVLGGGSPRNLSAEGFRGFGTTTTPDGDEVMMDLAEQPPTSSRTTVQAEATVSPAENSMSEDDTDHSPEHGKAEQVERTPAVGEDVHMEG